MVRGSDRVDLLASLAETHMAAGRVVEAAAAFERALAAAGARPPAARAQLHARHGWALHGAGRIAEAEAAFAQAVALDPEDVAALVALAGLKFRARRFDELEALAHRILVLRPGEPHSLFYLGRACMERGDWPGASAAFEGTLAAMPAHRNARAHLSTALQHVGRRDDARRILDYARLVTVEDVRAVPGFESMAIFHAALAARIRTFPTLMRDRPNRATIGGRQTADFIDDPSPAVVALRALVVAALERRLAAARPEDGLGVSRTHAWDLVGWAVVLPEGGHQSPHFHPKGMLSGIYYVDIPAQIGAEDPERAGHLVFGRSVSLDRPEAEAGFLSHHLAPRAGALVIFPSHFWHHTRPFTGAGERLCVAFDACPREGAVTVTGVEGY